MNWAPTAWLVLVVKFHNRATTPSPDGSNASGREVGPLVEAGRMGSHNPLPDSISDCGSTSGDIELDKNIAQVAINCARTNYQHLCDLTIRMAFSYQMKHL